MDRENLIKLAKGLYTQRASLNFNMGEWFEYIYDDNWDSARRAIHEEITPLSYGPSCGTAACAAGHGPLFVTAKHAGENWETYIRRVFGMDVTQTPLEFEWCFSPFWDSIDNTPQGAAKRIMYMLARGVPKKFKSCGYEASYNAYKNVPIDDLVREACEKS